MTKKQPPKTTLTNLKVFINSPAKQSRNVIDIRQMFADLKAARFLGRQIFIRDTKAMFRQSLLGFAWAILPPFLSGGLWIFLNYSGAVNITDTGIPYPIFVISGTLLFATFTQALNAPSDAVNAGKSMMAKLNFPREALLLTAFYKLLFDFGLKLLPILVIALGLGFALGWTALLFPLGALVLMLLGYGIGVLLIPFKMLYGDIGRMIALGTQLLMYATPIVYPMPASGFIRDFNTFNPLYYLISIPRDWFTGIPVVSVVPLWVGLIVALIILFFGWVLYRITMPIIIERVGA
jgi:lipopolysaccharide transport system permease protein